MITFSYILFLIPNQSILVPCFNTSFLFQRKDMNSLACSMSSSGQIIPVSPMESACIPTIDLARLNHCFEARSIMVDNIARACKEMGCFQIVNHGISRSVMKGALAAALDFFELPSDQKTVLESDDIRKPVRYGAGSKDGISNSRSFLKQYAHPLEEWIQFWPLSPPDYRYKMGNYALEVRRVALQLMDAILESLGINQVHLNNKMEEGMQVLAVNFYPQCPTADVMPGLSPHSDYGFITILLQSCQGLQIVGGDGEDWRAVPEVPETLHVHIGDHLEVLSNGQYRSLVHRAILNHENKRVSVASIHGFSMNEKVTVAKELVDEQHPKGYKESSFTDFLDYISTSGITNRRSFIDSLRITGT